MGWEMFARRPNAEIIQESPASSRHRPIPALISSAIEQQCPAKSLDELTSLATQDPTWIFPDFAIEFVWGLGNPFSVRPRLEHGKMEIYEERGLKMKIYWIAKFPNSDEFKIEKRYFGFSAFMNMYQVMRRGNFFTILILWSFMWHSIFVQHFLMVAEILSFLLKKLFETCYQFRLISIRNHFPISFPSTTTVKSFVMTAAATAGTASKCKHRTAE